MTAPATSGGGHKTLVLTAMIFAVAMTFIDQTIVSIAAPNVQHELQLSSTGVQWAINAYLLTLAAFFALGGRLADTLGHRKMVILGVVIFAVASGMCGLTPGHGTAAETWIVAFRALQGVGGALMYPAALAIVVNTYELRERGKALALFFGIAGGLTAIGPVLGGYLTEWTWRAIFWVNIPVAIIALILIVLSRPSTAHAPAKLDYRGAVLIAAGIALSIIGFQQSSIWGWDNVATWACIVIGLALLVVFFRVESRTQEPLMNVGIFRIRAFFVENVVLGISMLVFVPVFFFASLYAQVALSKSASNAGIFLLYFFIGFVIAAQIGGRMLDRAGAKRPVFIGCVLAAVGFWLWGNNVTSLSFGDQQWYIILAGAGMGFMLGPASTDAVNRASRLSYGEATGITQTVRNYAASLGLAVLGTIMVNSLRSRVTSSLIDQGLPRAQAEKVAETTSQASHGTGGSGSTTIPHFIQVDFAYAIRNVLWVMAAVMAVAAIVAYFGLQWGRQQPGEEMPTAAGSAEQPTMPSPSPERG
ncbi:MAG TPA: MFS transporter [Micromonosporaceae bacterium]|jgi:EmrB/QacA subfamily drug resistance transporter